MYKKSKRYNICEGVGNTDAKLQGYKVEDIS